MRAAVRGRACQAVKDDGSRCEAAPLTDREYCFWHDPDHAEEVVEAGRLGGLRRRKEHAVSGAYDFNGLDSVSEVRRLLEIAALDTLSLENSVARSRTLAYLAQVALRALEVGDLEERLKDLETAVRARSQRTPGRRR